MLNTDVPVFYDCLPSMNIVNLIFVSCCHLANTNKNECNHCCYLYSLGGRQLCQNFEPNGILTLTFDLESGVRVTCDVRYLFANFSLRRPLCSRLRPDVRDRRVRRQTDRRQTCIIA